MLRKLWWILALTAVGVLFVYNVWTHYFLGDDSFISFRYARHLASGAGLTWNPGERVEGYTNFSWVVLIAAAMRLGVSPERAAPAVGFAAGAAVLLSVWLFDRRFSSSSSLWSLVPVLLLAVSRTFAAWCTGGLETMLFTLLVFLAIWSAIEYRRGGRLLAGASGVLIGFGALTRPEGVLFGAVIGFWMLVDALVHRGRVRPFLLWLFPVVAIVGAHLLWRHAYYGEWLPNTFAAKVPAPWVQQGLKYAWFFTRAYGLPLFAPFALLPFTRRPDWERALVMAAVATYGLYVLSVGGDRFEFRFWVPVLPLSYWLVSDGIRRMDLRPLGRVLAVGALLSFTLFGTLQNESRQLPRRHGIAHVGAIRKYAATRAWEGRILRGYIEDGTLPHDIVVAVTGAGAVPYYTDWTTVDALGLNDRYIAHLPLQKRGVIAHERHAPLAYLRARGVVVFDALNRLVYPPDALLRLPEHVTYDNEPLRIRVVQLPEYCLAFVTLVPDEEFGRVFQNLKVLR